MKTGAPHAAPGSAPGRIRQAGRPASLRGALLSLALAGVLLGLLAAAPVAAQDGATATLEACFDCDLAGTRAAAQLLARGTLGSPTPAEPGEVVTPTPEPEACFDCDLAGTRAAAQLLLRGGLGSLTRGADQAVVRAVLFWMSGCGACHYVMDTVLPPIEQQYGAQLEITRIEVRSADDVDALMALAEDLGISRGRVGVPFLIVGGEVMIGSQEILTGLVARVEHHLAQGGLAYPDHPALLAYLPAGAELAAIEAAAGAGSGTGADASRLSPGAAWAIVVGLSVLGALAIVAVRRARRSRRGRS